MMYVLYVSCRSPLNIVHAGLDIVRHEIEVKEGSSVVQISADTAKMIENIFLVPPPPSTTCCTMSTSTLVTTVHTTSVIWET